METVSLIRNPSRYTSKGDTATCLGSISDNPRLGGMKALKYALTLLSTNKKNNVIRPRWVDRGLQVQV